MMYSPRLVSLFLPVVSFALAASTALATPVNPSLFSESVYASGMPFPTGMAFAPDGSGRLFVICKGGEVRVVQRNAGTATGTLASTPWAVLSPVVTSGECGLIGMCFDPGFRTNRYVYFFVTTSTPNGQQIIRYTDNPATNTGSNPTVIISNLPTRGGNHNGGGLGIGPDGRLYWSVGDNANNVGANNDLVSLGSKVGRANRFTGVALNDNPFNDGAGPNNDFVWARGFRNPFTLCFQPASGKLWLNVVGSSTTSLTKGYEQAFTVPRGGHGGWNAYENSQPSGYLAPAISYRIGAALSTAIAANGAVRNNGTVTFTTTGFHPLRKGAKVTIAGVTDPGFNGTFYVASRISDTQFTITQAGANASSGNGTATSDNLGQAITGGCFYDSTAFPAAYVGNYFFGDYSSGRMVRAVLDANDEPTMVDTFATAIGQQVDSAVGPDGALYSLRHLSSGSIRRIAAISSQQNLIVQPTTLGVMEGGSAVFNVSLAAAPAADVTVTISKTSGDSNLAISGAATLTFTPANWNVCQGVVLAASEDSDRVSGSAVFKVSSTGLASWNVTAREVENDEPRLVLSKNLITLNEGASTALGVSLAEAPTTNVTVTTSRTSGDQSVSVTAGSSLVFTPANFATPQAVTLAALPDDNSVSGTAKVSVALSGDPTRVVEVTVNDNGNASPTITSTPPLTAVINAPYKYAATATGNPAPTFSLPSKPAGMAVGATSGLVTWTPAATGTYAVTLMAGNNYGNAATQSFSVVVNPDRPPQALITAPAAGSTISGTNAEFYGNGVDDVGAVKAEFYVDGVLVSTDLGEGGHFHINGDHNLFNTTLWSNGSHTLRMRVTDTIGQTGYSEVQVFFANGVNP